MKIKQSEELQAGDKLIWTATKKKRKIKSVKLLNRVSEITMMDNTQFAINHGVPLKTY